MFVGSYSKRAVSFDFELLLTYRRRHFLSAAGTEGEWVRGHSFLLVFSPPSVRPGYGRVNSIGNLASSQRQFTLLNLVYISIIALSCWCLKRGEKNCIPQLIGAPRPVRSSCECFFLSVTLSANESVTVEGMLSSLNSCAARRSRRPSSVCMARTPTEICFNNIPASSRTLNPWSSFADDHKTNGGYFLFAYCIPFSNPSVHSTPWINTLTRRRRLFLSQTRGGGAVKPMQCDQKRSEKAEGGKTIVPEDACVNTLKLWAERDVLYLRPPITARSVSCDPVQVERGAHDDGGGGRGCDWRVARGVIRYRLKHTHKELCPSIPHFWEYY